ncbi:hypothetical protein J2Z62_000466 [Mycoplasmoides fastidiosum]|uniref:Uncharacterized protein n=1 Tax=Mycoplasmoides fastidiosum TaxID=92758 RepID=A0ABU0LZ92_9BACT|nr:hypothetical protein [Mycoplasmoides fastidiosum]MDQ0514028.1 hypothetical protein [Mycoplasmoides fastidiosum]UUD37562.1 hypothetical protein NPA10_03275 [Mycoplasmoides fastidiosum]
MLKAFVIQFDEVFAHLKNYRTAAWKQTFAQIDPNFPISQALMQNLLKLKNSSDKIIFWSDFAAKCRIDYPQIKAVKAVELVKLYDRVLLQILNEQLSDDCLDPHLLSELSRLNKMFDVICYVLNFSELSNLIWTKLKIGKNYPFIHRAFAEPQLKSLNFVENQVIKMDQQQLLDWMSSKKIRPNEIIVIAKKIDLIKTVSAINCYVVGVDNACCRSYCELDFETSRETIDLDQVCFGYHAKN